MRHQTILPAVALAAVLIPAAGIAKSPDCTAPRNQSEMNICAHLDYQAADGDLNFDYRMARDEMRNLDSRLSTELLGAEKALLNAQRSWIKYRDQACQAEGFIVRGGSMGPLVVSSCLARLTRQRSEDLRRLFENN